MRRLKHPNNVLHFPTLGLDDVGAYIDAKASKAILSFKKDGINIPGAPNLTAVGGTLATGLSVSASYSDDGIFQSRLLTLNAPAKAEDIYYDFGVTLQTMVKLPGVGTRHKNTFEKSYGGTLDVVETSGGYVTDAYKLLMENDILDFITNDVSIHSQETDPRISFAGSIASAYRVYKVVTDQPDLTGTNVVITYSPSDGGADITVTLDKLTLILNLEAANSDLSAEPVMVLAGGASTYYFVSTTAGDKFTMSTATSAHSGTTTRHIQIVAKDEEVKFDVSYMQGEWTQTSFGIQQLTYVASGNTSWNFNNGTSETIATGANSAAFVANIIGGTAGAAGLVYAGKIAAADTYLQVVFLSGTKTVSIKPNDTYFTTSNATNYLLSSATGKYPSLTSDEVFKVVFNKKDGGRLSAMQRLDQPAASTTYAKYTIKQSFDMYGESLASEDSTYTNEVVIYMPKTVAQTNVWDVSESLYASTATTADTTFEGLLGLWSDLAVSSW